MRLVIYIYSPEDKVDWLYHHLLNLLATSVRHFLAVFIFLLEKWRYLSPINKTFTAFLMKQKTQISQQFGHLGFYYYFHNQLSPDSNWWEQKQAEKLSISLGKWEKYFGLVGTDGPQASSGAGGNFNGERWQQSRRRQAWWGQTDAATHQAWRGRSSLSSV